MSLESIITIAVMLVGFGAQWGAWRSTVKDIEKRVEAIELAQAEYRRDTRVVEAIQRVAVIENNVSWIRQDVTEIKNQLKKGAQ